MPLEEQTVIDQIARFYTDLQRAYRKWAAKFISYEEIIEWLTENKIPDSTIEKCQKQISFNLLSSNWNPITIPTLYSLVPDYMTKIRDGFATLFRNRTQSQINQIWYLLYFIHPVRHELYYFKVHYPDGYSPRLAKLIRSHRLGLRSAKTYLSKDGRTIDGSHINACGTMAFKHLHLHPTTSALRKPNLRDLKEESILHLEMGDGDLSSDELEIAVALSTKATPSFERWINYAQCAINEGPVFTLKENKEHSDCCKEIVEILRRPDLNQEMIGAKLEEYYFIEV